MSGLSACVEWLFAEGERPIPDRIRAAAAAGFKDVEFWTTTNKDVDALERAINESGVAVAAFVSEPAARIIDRSTHDEFISGIERSCRLANRLNARNLIIVSGDELPDVPRGDQRHAIADALRRAAPIATEAGVGLLLEPLNTRIDHPGYFLDSTTEAIEIVRAVGEPSVKVLYDMYHSIVMGEDPARVLSGAGDLIGHVHIADVPGRHEPGTGGIDWPKQLEALHHAGYDGALGLEFRPLHDTESSIAMIRRLAS